MLAPLQVDLAPVVGPLDQPLAVRRLKHGVEVCQRLVVLLLHPPRDAAIQPRQAEVRAQPDGMVQVRDSAASELRFLLKGHSDIITTLAISPDGKTLATGSPDKLIKLWDLATGKERLTLKGHTHWVYALAFSPDGARLATASLDRTVKIWDVKMRREIAKLERAAPGKE